VKRTPFPIDVPLVPGARYRITCSQRGDKNIRLANGEWVSAPSTDEWTGMDEEFVAVEPGLFIGTLRPGDEKYIEVDDLTIIEVKP